MQPSPAHPPPGQPPETQKGRMHWVSLRDIVADRDWRALGVITPFLRRYKWQVAIAAVCLLLITASTLAVPWFMKLIVDDLAHPEAKVLAVPFALLIAYGAVRFASVLLRENRDSVFGRVSVRAQRRLSLRVLRHLHGLDLEYHLSRRTGGISRDLDRGVESIAGLMRIMVFSIIPTILQLVGVSVVLLVAYNGWYAALTAAAALVYAGYTIYVTEWRTPIIRASNETNSRANDRAIDSLINYETVKQFGNEQHEAKLYDGDLKVWEDARRRNRLSMAVLNSGQSLLTTIGITLMMVLAAQQVVDGSMTVGDLVLINAYANNVFMTLNNLGGTYREFKRCLTDIERMFDILETEPVIRDAPDATPLPTGRADVHFEDVHFRYQKDRPILRGVSFSVPAGQRVAIVGPSGAGKSTITRLLFRFYDPAAGCIRIGDADIRTAPLADLRARIAIVPQDTTLFNSTLYDNIAYGCPGAPEAEVLEAARLAHLDGLIERLPARLATVVGERGLKLSGGEKQRVAIARALLKKPSILVFDEATSSLDSASEQAILANIREISAGHTTLVIAHRLSTVADADHIVVLDDGTVSEAGTHAELFARGGLYRHLWDLQQSEGAEERNTAAHGEGGGDAAPALGRRGMHGLPA